MSNLFFNSSCFHSFLCSVSPLLRPPTLALDLIDNRGLDAAHHLVLALGSLGLLCATQERGRNEGKEQSDDDDDDDDDDEEEEEEDNNKNNNNYNNDNK